MPDSEPLNTKSTQAKQLSSKVWQAEFAQSVFKGLSESLSNTLVNQSPEAQVERFAIYQNNVFYSLIMALADLYPAIKTLVGDDFFDGTANAYIRAHPPKQAAMVHFGWSFPQFLADFEHTQAMPYLTDIAKLELARHQAYHAADTAILDRDFFAQIEAEAFEQARIELHPSLTIMKSASPVFTIWQANQKDKEQVEREPPEAGENIHLDEPQWLIIVRCQYEVLVFNIDEGTYLFYQGLANKLSINEAVAYSQDNTTDSQGDFDISAAIVLGISNGFFTQLKQNHN